MDANAALRVAVAKDVLDSMNKYSPTTGEFCEPTSEACDEAFKHSGDAKKMARALMPGCELCALGACLMSLVAIDNNFDFIPPGVALDVVSIPSLLARLLTVFEPVQLALIEYAFEQGEGYLPDRWDEIGLVDYPTPADSEALDRAKDFGMGIDDPKDRLRDIMLNIIENEGTFVV